MPRTLTHGGLDVTVQTIDAEMAQKLLDTVNTANRRMNPHRVRLYATEMTAGRWHPLVGEPISFADDGTLLNGQHRLQAIIDSNTEQDILVVGGLPMAAQDAMDAGATRKAGQQFTIHGWKNGTGVAACARLLLQWHGGALLSDLYRPSTEELVAFAGRYRDRMDASVTIGQRVRRTTPLLASAVSAVAFTAYDMAADKPHRFTENDVNDFFAALESGANLEKGHPILTLRNTAARRQTGGNRIQAPRELFNVVRTWNAWRDEETLDKLQLPKGGKLTEAHLKMH